MILLSLASKQIWPQVLAVAHLAPEQVFLLHSEDAVESKGPAQRLKRFFDASGLVPRGVTYLEAVLHDDFSAIEIRFDEIIAKHQLNLRECLVNFTGGNKLMATAVFRRVARRGVRAFYLERGNQVTWFEPRDGDMETSSERLDASLTNKLDSAALLSCQFGDEVVQSSGERLTLNEKGRNAAPQDLAAKLQGETRLDRNAFDFPSGSRLRTLLPANQTKATTSNTAPPARCSRLASPRSAAVSNCPRFPTPRTPKRSWTSSSIGTAGSGSWTAKIASAATPKSSR